MKSALILPIVFCLILISCKAKVTRSTLLPEQSYTFDTANFAVIRLTNNAWVFGNVNPTDLTVDEILKIETILAKCIVKYNLGELQKYDSILKEDNEISSEDKDAFIKGAFIVLSKYKRQYFPVINSKGEKEIWVNCFCDLYADFDWRNEIFEVSDGGKCFFNVIINLSSQSYYDLRVNGS